MRKSHLALVAPTTVYGTVVTAGPPKRRGNAEVRSREYLTDAEVNRLISAAGENRNGHRDATMVLVAYRHGLRAGELVTLRWDAVDFAHGRLHVSRLKGSAESVHPLSGRELRALRRLKREQDATSPFIFTSERGAPFTTAGFRKMIARCCCFTDMCARHRASHKSDAGTPLAISVWASDSRVCRAPEISVFGRSIKERVGRQTAWTGSWGYIGSSSEKSRCLCAGAWISATAHLHLPQ